MCTHMTTTQAAENKEEKMKNINFGIEIETLGRTRETIAKAICRIVGGTYYHVGGTYDAWKVKDAKDRVWKVVTDSSINAGRAYQAEVVSPVLQYTDIEELQEVVRSVRKVGARVDSSTGIHIHLDAAAFDTKSLKNLVKIVNSKESLIEQALGISEARRARWCRGVDQDFLKKIEKARNLNLDQMNSAWYGQYNPNPVHYDQSRYHGLNLHNIWYRGTVEFRYFNGTLHAGKVKAYIQFCLALGAKAITAKSASSKKRTVNLATSKYDFRVFLLSLGLIGEEFKTARLHLLKQLQGSAAWKNTMRQAA